MKFFNTPLRLRRALLLCLVVSVWPLLQQAQAQSVPNPYFEIHTQCPQTTSDREDELVKCGTHWYSPSHDGSFMWASPDYFNFCAPTTIASVPINHFGNQVDGNSSTPGQEAYGGIITSLAADGLQNREYLTTELSSPLLAGHIYEVSFRVSLAETGHHIGGGDRFSPPAIQRIGAYFSTTSPDKPNVIQVPIGIPFPGVEYRGTDPLIGTYLSDRNAWMEIKGTYAVPVDDPSDPDKSNKWFLTIGNFQDVVPRNEINPPFTPNEPWTYYYVDNINIRDIDPNFECFFDIVSVEPSATQETGKCCYDITIRSRAGAGTLTNAIVSIPSVGGSNIMNKPLSLSPGQTTTFQYCTAEFDGGEKYIEIEFQSVNQNTGLPHTCTKMAKVTCKCDCEAIGQSANKIGVLLVPTEDSENGCCWDIVLENPTCRLYSVQGIKVSVPDLSHVQVTGTSGWNPVAVSGGIELQNMSGTIFPYNERRVIGKVCQDAGYLPQTCMLAVTSGPSGSETCISSPDPIGCEPTGENCCDFIEIDLSPIGLSHCNLGLKISQRPAFHGCKVRSYQIIETTNPNNEQIVYKQGSGSGTYISFSPNLLAGSALHSFIQGSTAKTYRIEFELEDINGKTVICIKEFTLPACSNGGPPGSGKQSTYGIYSNQTLITITPNPASDQVSISVTSPFAASVKLEIYNGMGQRVGTIHTGALSTGISNFSYSLEQLPQGTYFVKLTTSDEVETLPFVITR